MDAEIHAMPTLIRRKGMDIHIDAPILSDSLAIKNAISEGLARVAEAIQLDVVSNKGGEFGDSQSEGFIQGRNNPLKRGTYPSAQAYYSNNKVPFWRGGLRGSFAYIGPEDWSNHLLKFTASYAVGIEQGDMAGIVDGAWVTDKLDRYWQQTHDGWSGELELTTTHKHPYTAGVAENINLNLESFGYLQIFGAHFTASIKG